VGSERSGIGNIDGTIETWTVQDISFFVQLPLEGEGDAYFVHQAISWVKAWTMMLFHTTGPKSHFAAPRRSATRNACGYLMLAYDLSLGSWMVRWAYIPRCKDHLVLREQWLDRMKRSQRMIHGHRQRRHSETQKHLARHCW